VEFVFSDTHQVTLNAGESVSFNSRIPHRWVNSGPDILHMLWTNARPPRQTADPNSHLDIADKADRAAVDFSAPRPLPC
jgi:hypothetical protein